MVGMNFNLVPGGKYIDPITNQKNINPRKYNRRRVRDKCLKEKGMLTDPAAWSLEMTQTYEVMHC